jgi:hypothetical protein
MILVRNRSFLKQKKMNLERNRYFLKQKKKKNDFREK